MSDTQEDRDELRPEYDLKTLRVRRTGPGRASFPAVTVALDPDVAAVFGTAAAVNEALRFLIKVTKESPHAPSATIDPT